MITPIYNRTQNFLFSFLFTYDYYICRSRLHLQQYSTPHKLTRHHCQHTQGWQRTDTRMGNRMGTRGAYASRVLGMFFCFVSLSIITTRLCTTRHVITPTHSGTAANGFQDWDSRRRCVSSPWYVFFPYYIILVSLLIWEP
jgi:hypothetical protein